MHRVQPAEAVERNNCILNHSDVGTIEGHTGATKLACFDYSSGSAVGSPPTELHGLKVSRCLLMPLVMTVLPAPRTSLTNTLIIGTA
jgi:hypothetical protein